MTENFKERTHRLCELGGTVVVAGLDTLDPAELLGLLLEAKKSYNILSKEKKELLKNRGLIFMKKRKVKKKENP